MMGQLANKCLLLALCGAKEPCDFGIFQGIFPLTTLDNTDRICYFRST